MGTMNRLFPCANGIAENHTGGVLGASRGDSGTEMGITLAGPSLSGKWEISGVPGGERIRENSAASEESIVCFGESTTKRLVLSESNWTRFWGVMSFAKSRRYEVRRISLFSLTKMLYQARYTSSYGSVSHRCRRSKCCTNVISIICQYSR